MSSNESIVVSFGKLKKLLCVSKEGLITESSENKGNEAKFDCNVKSLNAGRVKRDDLNFLCLFVRGLLIEPLALKTFRGLLN